jgi:hypothetical protein
MRRSILALILLSAATSSCSSDEEKADKYPTLTAFCEGWADAACSEKAVDNCASSVEACRPKQTSTCLTLVPPGFSSQFAEECINAIAAAYADGVLEQAELEVVLKLASPCDRLANGPGKVGDPCTTDHECDRSADLSCVALPGEATGTCQKPVVVQAGFACGAPDQVCDEGFYCNGTHCVVRLTSGACTAEEQCADAYTCDVPEANGDAGAASAGTCVERLANGTACTEHADCKSGVCQSVCVTKLNLSPNEPHCQTLR